METPLNDSMPDFSALHSTLTATEDESASPVANNVGGVKELLTVPGQEGKGGDEPTTFFSRRPSFRGGSRDPIERKQI